MLLTKLLQKYSSPSVIIPDTSLNEALTMTSAMAIIGSAWFSKISGHGTNPIFFNKTKTRIKSRKQTPEHLLLAPTSDDVSFLPPPLVHHVPCMTSNRLPKVFFACYQCFD